MTTKAQKLRTVLEIEEHAAQKVLEDAIDRYRKRQLDLLEAWHSVSSAQSRLSQARDALINPPVLPA